MINTRAWKIANSTTSFSESGTAHLQFGNTVSFQVGGIPTGAGYTATLTGTTADGSLTCAGSATFAVSLKGVASVHVTLLLGRAPRRGSRPSWRRGGNA